MVTRRMACLMVATLVAAGLILSSCRRNKPLNNHRRLMIASPEMTRRACITAAAFVVMLDVRAALAHDAHDAAPVGPSSWDIAFMLARPGRKLI